METHRVFALEGLDGVGKTTAGKILAEQVPNAIYLYAMDGNDLSPYRKMFDTASVGLRFLYYLAVAYNTYMNAERLRQTDNVFIDRGIASTIAYHRAFGLPDSWLYLIPQCLSDQIDTMIYLTATNAERKRRMGSRAVTSQTMTYSDNRSLIVGQRIDEEYRIICPEKTLVICTDDKSPQSVVNEIRKNINV